MTNLLIRLFVKNSEDINNPEVRQRYGNMTGGIGIFLNLCLFATKLFVGIITNSVSIMADAFNNLSDSGSSVISLVSFRMAEKPPDEEHPFGHGRIEYIAGFIISALILLMGYEFFRTSLSRITNHGAVEITTPVLILLLLTVFVKLWMFFFYSGIGKKIDSTTLRASAFDCIGDCLATTVVLIGAAVTYLTGLYIDGYIGILVAIFIIVSGVKSGKEAIDDLIGTAPSQDKIEQVKQIVGGYYPNILGIKELRMHDYGPGRKEIILIVTMPDDFDLEEAHRLISHAEQEIADKTGAKVIIHVDPVKEKHHENSENSEK